jgi:cell division protein ZapA
VVGLDRIAVISALNLANELIKLRKHGTALDGDVGARLQKLRERVEAALERGQQMEL